ncbi:MAG: TIGR03943 family protein [Microbacterium sp. 69-7]|uniref:TIGR03943 family protein n=1 Tax=Microbacterium laevaniformans TaxID=36807 RepID=A0A150HIX2_9MICO|nr:MULTISPECIES: TIGR03943 family protein [Microbacterium]KXZ61670.1 hypothetical protein Mlaev_00292 [Microbacterium laevaniformans]OJU47443.1 MAG: TIGR03943 family protein [Microbacterium sp. 69-7]
MRELIGSRLLGVGLAAGLAAVTVVLWLNGQLALYINPSSNWFAVPMAVIALVGAVISFALPKGAESDHGHDHDHGHERRSGWGTAATVTGGVLSVGVVAAIMLTPPATLSAELAMQRDTGAPPLFQGSDTVALASTGDTSKFGVGEWASVFATATNPEAFDGDTITLTGFVTPTDGGFGLTRLVITHCVIDAQPASVPVASGDIPATGTWVTVTGTIRDAGGRLQIQPASVQTVDQPKDPYEY